MAVVASMRPAQLRRFAPPAGRPACGEGIASMRPAQLRRFARRRTRPPQFSPSRFNEAGAAAPVCPFQRRVP